MSINHRRKLQHDFHPNCMKGEESCRWLTLKLKRLHRWQDSLCLELAEYIHPLKKKLSVSAMTWQAKKNPHYLHHMQKPFHSEFTSNNKLYCHVFKSWHEWGNLMLMLKDQIIKNIIFFIIINPKQWFRWHFIAIWTRLNSWVQHTQYNCLLYSCVCPLTTTIFNLEIMWSQNSQAAQLCIIFCIQTFQNQDMGSIVSHTNHFLP